MGQERKLSLIEVALAVANSMIGLSLLYFPQLFMESGLVAGVISLIVLGVMMAYTCSLWSQHLNPSENDIGDIVLRVLKNKMYIIFSLSSGIALCLLTMAIFLMISQLLYILILQILEAADVHSGFREDTSGIHFGQFSIQYLGLILLVLMGYLMTLKSIKKVLLITRFASLLMIIYFIQVLVFFIENLTTDRVKENGVKLLPQNFSGAVGLICTVLFAFISHPSVSPILKNAKNPLTNTKSINIAYLFGVILFSLIGVFGGIGLLGRQRKGGSSVISYFPNQALSYTMGIPILMYLLSIFSIYPFVARNQLLSLLQQLTKKQNLKQRYHYHFSFTLIFVILLGVVLNIDTGIIISFIGAVMCWLACFLFPCLIRLKEGKPVYDIQSLISEEEMIPQRIRVSTGEKVWIYLVISTGSFLMVADLYYILDSLINS